jgi:hypothetical protein
MALHNNNSLILKLKFLMGLIQNLNRVNQNHSYHMQWLNKKEKFQDQIEEV